MEGFIREEWGLKENQPVSGCETYIDWAPPVSSIAVATVLRQTFSKGRSHVALSTLSGHIDAARAGIGIANLPRTIGDADPSLHRLGGLEKNVSLDAWLVQPQQFRHLARVKAVGQFVNSIFKERTKLRVAGK